MIKIKMLIQVLIYILLIPNVFAQDLNNGVVSHYSIYFGDYKSDYNIIIRTIEADTQMTLEQKLNLKRSEIAKLKKRFSEERKREYQRNYIVESITHTCTSGVKGKVRDCNYVYIHSPVDGMITRLSDTRVDGHNKGVLISSDGKSAGLKMTVAGKGKNQGTLFATFRYSPEFIDSAVQNDTIALFNLLSS